MRRLELNVEFTVNVNVAPEVSPSVAGTQLIVSRLRKERGACRQDCGLLFNTSKCVNIFSFSSSHFSRACVVGIFFRYWKLTVLYVDL